jgi:tRNA dimethylallyltransferase
MSELLGEPAAPRLPFRVIKVVLDPLDRAALHARIADRFHGMLRVGFLEEVERLRARGDLGPDLASMRAVGYRQVWVHLEGRIDYASMVDQGIRATRQLAKRQLTWLRAEPDAARIDATAPDAGEQVSRFLGSSLT